MMKNNIPQSGFTLIEILVAVFIMSVGFLAFSQMQYFSLQQKYKAEIGTTATNIIQFAADSDIALAKDMQSLNSTVAIDVIAQRTPDYSYCDSGGADNMDCGECPCNPLSAFALDPTTLGSEASCSVVNIVDYDPRALTYTDLTTCLSTLESFATEAMVVVRTSNISQSVVDSTTVQTINLIYGVKSSEQFRETPGSVTIRDTLATQAFAITAHIDNFNESGQITNNASEWQTVRVPHLP